VGLSSRNPWECTALAVTDAVTEAVVNHETCQ
jgi:hypothetical protein